MQFKPVTHVIFDMDGLLLESESAYERILGSMTEKFGKQYTLDIKLKVLGTAEPETASIIIRECQLPISHEEFLVEYRAKMKEELKNPMLMPGAEKLVEHLSKKGVPIAVATSSSMDSYEIKTQNHRNLFKYFNHVVCASSDPEVEHGKPAPDIFLVCASRFPDKPSASKCLVLEDAPNGVKGALAAGMQAVLVPAEEVSDELRKPATLVIKSLEDFKPELFGLPPFE
ncbi:pseudouridine-5'-phosphatase-like isoform X2 [Cylas formicarius]|nr:pseudouridine-5'-phosphatase-like isoform X2 [Cylas formicarius]